MSSQSRRRALPPLPVESDSESRSTMDTTYEPRRDLLAESSTPRSSKVSDPEHRSSGNSYSSFTLFHAFRKRPKSAVSASANMSTEYRERERSSLNNAFAGPSTSSSHYRSKRERITSDQGAARHSLPIHSSRRHTQLSADESDKGKDRVADRQAYSGTAAERDRMKEIDMLKKALHDSKKTAKKQAKKIEELKQELSMAQETKSENEQKLSTLKTKCQQSEELISTIESTIQCQICMDLPHKPFGLAPCGHVFCLPCLKGWFKKAPPSLDDMDMDPDELNSPDYVMRRAKSCPTCRSPVRHRPAPIFMIKEVASALAKAKAPLSPFFGNRGRTASPPLDPECDPWEGIFMPSDEEVVSDEDEEGDLFMDAVQWAFRGAYPLGMDYEDDSDSRSEDDDDDDDDDDDEDDDEDQDEEDADDDNDDEEEDDGSDEHEIHSFTGRYVQARWEPPTVDVFVYEDSDPMVLNLLRRGCNWLMIRKYRMSYAHDIGIVAHVHSVQGQIALFDDDDEIDDDSDRVFLGWNIRLDETDHTGDFYIEQTLRDISEYPERWSVTPRPRIPNAYDARKMVRADDLDDYVTTDTEVWLDAEDLD